MPKARQHTFRVRLTDEEKSRLIQNARTLGCTPSELIRKTAIYGQKISPTIIDMERIRKMQTELRKQGGNLNQLMRSINTFGLHSHNPKEVKNVVDKTADTINEVHKLIIDIREGRLNL